MRFTIIGALILANAILNVKAFLPHGNSCWSYNDYLCCSPTTRVAYLDEKGMWGIENNSWCGIIDRIQWTGKDKFYPLCNTCVITYTDSDGDWGIENDQWCGIDKRCYKIYQKEEWTGKSRGYPVCSGCLSDYKVILVNEEGRWAMENDQQCGIRNDCNVEREAIECKWGINMDSSSCIQYQNLN